MLGAKPEIGRLIGQQIGGDPNVIGRSVRLDNDVYTIVGVLPSDFRHPGPTISRALEVWLVGGFIADPFPKPTRAARWLPGAIGRLKPGITIAQAQAALTSMAAEIRRDFPHHRP